MESTSSVPKVDMTTVQERLLDILNSQIAVKSAAPESLSSAQEYYVIVRPSFPKLIVACTRIENGSRVIET